MINVRNSFKRFIVNKPAAQLAIIAGLSGFIYALIFTLRFPLVSHYYTIPPVDYAKLTHHAPSGLRAYILGLGVLFWLYLWAIRLVAPTNKQEHPAQIHSDIGGQPSAVGGRFIFLSSVTLATISIFSYPLTAIDLFIYAIRTRGWALYGLNPLTTAPETLPDVDPWLGLAGEWVDAPSPYGPLWELFSLDVFYLSGGDFLAHLFALKIVATLAYLGCVWLVYKILQRLQPEWATAGAIAFGWSPLVLLESVQNGHNDIVMVFFLLAAVWALAKWVTNHHPKRGLVSGTNLNRGGSHAAEIEDNRRLPSVGVRPAKSAPRRTRLTIEPFLLLTCVFLALSILVKFVTVIIVPFFLIGIAMTQPKWGQRLVTIMLYGTLTAGLVVLAMLPFWPGLNGWAVLQAGGGAGRSLLALLVLALRDPLGTNIAFDVSRNLIMFIFAMIYLYYLWQTLTNLRQASSTSPSFGSSFDFAQDKAQDKPSNLSISSAPLSLCLIIPPYVSFFVLFWYVLLAAPVFHAWYLLWFLPFAVLLLPYRRPLIVSTVFSMTALLVIPYFETIRVWYPILLDNHLLGHLIGVPLLIVPPLIAILWPIGSPGNSEV